MDDSLRLGLSVLIGVLIAVGLLVAMAVSMARPRAQEAASTWTRALMVRFGGKLRHRWGTSELALSRAGFDITVPLSRPGGGGIRVSARSTRPLPGRVTIASAGGATPGSDDAVVPTGDREFDSLYRVTGRSESFARDAVDAEVRTQVRRLGRVAGVWLSVRPRGLELAVGEVAFDESERERLTEIALSLVLHLASTLASTEPAAAPAVLDLPGSTCEICGMALRGQLVTCTRCATPHHADCWRFNGRCAIYGCGSEAAR